MTSYRFELVNGKVTGPTATDAQLRLRPILGSGGSFAADARRFVAGEALDTAINTAIAVNQPLLFSFAWSGTSSETEAVQRTFVLPIWNRQDPSGYFR